MISHITHHKSFEFSLAAIYRKGLLLALSSLAAVLLLPGRSTAQQATLTDDAQTSAAAPNQNFGSNVSVRVSGANIQGFFKFKLTPNLPPGTTSSHIGKATLKLFVGGVTTPGTFDVLRVTGAWNEATVTGNTAPPLGALEGAISVDATQTNQWVTLDVTQLIKDWLDGVLPNEGIALVANGGVGNVIFNSKENQTTSHESGVEIVLNHAATADRATNADNAANATNATNAVNAATANALAGSATVNGNQVSGDLTNATIAGSRVNGTVAVATNATTADAARGVVRAASDADIVSPIAGQLYFNTTMNVFRQYDSTVWKTIDAALAAQLSSAGTLNAPNNPVDWTQLKNVPANAASGYTAGGGININGSNVISNTGVISVGATAPLATSGGQNPTLSLAGVIPVANGGTGLNASGASGSFLRSDGGTWTSAVLTAADVPAGSASYIHNTTTPQASGNFNISGDGSAGGTLSANSVNSNTQYNLGGARVLGVGGSGNLFVGFGAGQGSTTGGINSFFGNSAGQSNSTGVSNSFFGYAAGQNNSEGIGNSFFGALAGHSNTTSGGNSFFGALAGQSNTGGNNSFFGSAAGTNNTIGSGNAFFGDNTGWANTTGGGNSFFGTAAGHFNTSGSSNASFGSNAGMNNTAGSSNTFVGDSAGLSNTTESSNTFIGANSNGAPDINNATAIGAGAQVTTSNTMVLGTDSIIVRVPGRLDVNGSAIVQTNVTIGNSSTGGGITLTNTTNRFAEIGSNVPFDSVSATVVGIRLKSTQPFEAYSYGIFHGSNQWPGSLVFRRDDESIMPADERNRLIIASNGDIIVGPGNLGVGTPSPAVRLDVVGDARASGNITAASFTGDGSGLTNVSASSTSLSCAGCVSESELDFNPGTQAELDAHKSSADHDSRYVAKTGGAMTGALNLPADGLNVGGSQLTLVNGNVGIGTVSPAGMLEVEGTTRLRNLVATPQDAGLEGGEISLQGAPGFHSWQMDNYSGRLRLHSQGVSRLEVTNAGNVGIGTDAPTNKLEVIGNVRVNGNFVATGSKSAVVTLPDNREVLLYAVESLGNWFEDFGHATLSNGVVHVEIDSTFAQTINTEMTYHVFLTPNGDCKGLYVAKKTATGFEVRELGGGQTNVTFDYRIVARRKGYETSQPGLAK